MTKLMPVEHEGHVAVAVDATEVEAGREDHGEG
jgi:hypothetical protein